jgi:hypothetical protein
MFGDTITGKICQANFVDLQARANYQRIATFQAHNIGTGLRKAQQQLVNLLLHCINQSSNVQITNRKKEMYKVLS